MKKTKVALMGMLFTALVSAYPAMAQEQTKDVWKHHIDAWNARDVAKILEDYSDTSAVIVNNKVFRGKEEIGKLFQDLFAIFGPAQEHVVDAPTIEGDVVYITWRAVVHSHVYPFGTDTFVIQDGKIAYQTITSDPKLFLENKK